MKQKFSVIILCLIVPIMYLLGTMLAHIAPVSSANKEIPQPAGLSEQKEFESMKKEYFEKSQESLPTLEPLPEQDDLPDITLKKPDNADTVVAEINQKEKEIMANVEKANAEISGKISTWQLPDLEEAKIPENKKIVMSSIDTSIDKNPTLPSFDELKNQLPKIELPETTELPHIQYADMPTLIIPEMPEVTLQPLPELKDYTAEFEAFQRSFQEILNRFISSMPVIKLPESFGT